jgi:hypothetical protein
MLADDFKQLPLAAAMCDLESCMSHTLRVLRANGVPMRRGLEWLGVPMNKPLRLAELRALAWALRVPHDWLLVRAHLRPEHRDQRWYRLGTHLLSGSACAPARTARLCARCVQQAGACNLSWTLRLVPGCARHRSLLLDSCPRCGQAISWDRPSVDICRCGHYFNARETQRSMPTTVVDWVQWIECRLPSGNGDTSRERAPGLPRLLDGMSLDGAIRLVEAFGLFRRAADQPRVALAAARSSLGMSEVIERGIERLKLIDADPRRILELAPTLHLAAIERLRADAVSEADAACAALLLRVLGAGSGQARDQRGRFYRGQLPLFT